jgi:DNA-binding CsgD family transcriptional regulator/Flp pilus assembly protein TadD
MLEGDLSGAGAILGPLYERASEEGDERSLPTLLIYLILLGVQTGNLGEAARFAQEACLIAAQTEQRARLAGALSCAAVVEAMMGRAVEACSASEEALSLVGREEPFPSVRSRWAMGIVHLERGDPEGARKHHEEAIEILAGTDVVEPSLWGLGRFLPDAVESFVSTGDLEGAEVVSADLSARAGVFPRPWTLAVSARCRGIVAAAQGDAATASEAFAHAVERHRLLDEPYELARTWLAQGIVDRRAKRRTEARAELEQARALFEEIGAEGWARRASLEFERTGIHAHTPEGLTPTELQVAQLVATGQTNREVADALFLSVRTVETNLTRVYRKLGLRSRTELAAHLPTEHAPN